MDHGEDKRRRDRFRVSDKELTTLTSQRDEWQRKTEVTEAEAEGWKRQAA